MRCRLNLLLWRARKALWHWRDALGLDLAPSSHLEDVNLTNQVVDKYQLVGGRESSSALVSTDGRSQSVPAQPDSAEAAQQGLLGTTRGLLGRP